MQVISLWRYPVKSLQGEQLESAEVTADGIRGDRRFAIFDLATDLGLTARRVPELLFASARLRPDGSAKIILPDGSIAADDEALSTWLGRRVQLRSVDAAGPRRYEIPEDSEQEASGPWEMFTGAPGPFHDSPRNRVSLVSTGTLGAWDQRRFRSNVLLDGAGEDDLVGERIHLGEVALSISKRVGRCVMTIRAQPGGIPKDPDVLRIIARERDACLAIAALVEHGGTVRVGDALHRDGGAAVGR